MYSIWVFHTLQAGSQSLEVDASSSQYVDMDLFMELSDYLCMTNPSSSECPNGFTLSVYLNIESMVYDSGVISTRPDAGTSGIQVMGASDPSRLRYRIILQLLFIDAH